jgi:hypothetical protein
MGPAIFGYARFGSIVFGTYGAEVGPALHDVIVVGQAEIRRVMSCSAMIHSNVNLVGSIRTKVNTTIER